MKTLVKTVLFGAFVFTMACNQSNKQLKTEAANANSTHETIAGDDVTACPHASKIFWSGSKPGGEHNGIIKLKEGKYIVEDGKLVGGEFIIDMNSLANIDIEDSAMNAKLVNDLNSVNFFNVDSFPEGKFVISMVSDIKDENFTHEIKGDLTLKSITHSISFKANIRVTDGAVSATSEEFVINRTLWNVIYGSKSIFNDLKDKFINDEIKLKLDMHSM